MSQKSSASENEQKKHAGVQTPKYKVDMQCKTNIILVTALYINEDTKLIHWYLTSAYIQKATQIAFDSQRLYHSI